MELEVDGDTKCNCFIRINPQMTGKETGRMENRRTREDHLINRIKKIGYYTEKSPGDFRRLSVTQIQVKDHQLVLEVEYVKKWHDNNNFAHSYIVSSIIIEDETAIKMYDAK